MDSYSTIPTDKAQAAFNFQKIKNVGSFLKELHLEQYTSVFIDEGFESLPAMIEITEEDLIALNVKRGHRRVIQRGIATLNGVPQYQPLNVTVPTIVNPPCPDLTRSNNGNNSSEGSSYNTSGYGSMSSPRHPTCIGQKYELINSNHYSNIPQIADEESNTSPTTNHGTKSVPIVIEGARSSSFSSNDDDENDSSPLKRKYRRHPKPDKKAPIKPPSAYIMFSNDARSQLKDFGMNFVEIAKYVGDQWKNLSINQKQQYERTAMRAKDIYIEELHAYSQTDDYKKYQAYLSKFKSEQDASNRKIARLRKRSKRNSTESMAESSSNNENKNTQKRTSDTSLGSSNSTDGGFNETEEIPRSSSSSGSADIYKVHLKNHPLDSQSRSDSQGSLVKNSNDLPTATDPLQLEDENNGGECYSPQQTAPPLISDNMAESNYHRLPFNGNTAAT